MTLSKKQIVTLIFTLTLIFALPIAIYLVRQRQNIRPHALQGKANFLLSSDVGISATAGQNINVLVSLLLTDPALKVSGVDFVLLYDKNLLDVGNIVPQVISVDPNAAFTDAPIVTSGGSFDSQFNFVRVTEVARLADNLLHGGASTAINLARITFRGRAPGSAAIKFPDDNKYLQVSGTGTYVFPPGSNAATPVPTLTSAPTIPPQSIESPTPSSLPATATPVPTSTPIPVPTSAPVPPTAIPPTAIPPTPIGYCTSDNSCPGGTSCVSNFCAGLTCPGYPTTECRGPGTQTAHSCGAPWTAPDGTACNSGDGTGICQNGSCIAQIVHGGPQPGGDPYCGNGPEIGCPICLAANTIIDTPGGPKLVTQLTEGMLVWTLDRNGNKLVAPILKTSSVPVPVSHLVANLVLADGRKLWVSPGHPGINGKSVGQLITGDIYDGSTVVSNNLQSYWDTKTYDILPAGDTGFYWANGILLGSTLRSVR